MATCKTPGTHVKMPKEATKAAGKQSTEMADKDYDRRTGWYGKKDNPKEAPSMDDYLRMVK